MQDPVLRSAHHSIEFVASLLMLAQSQLSAFDHQTADMDTVLLCQLSLDREAIA